MSLPDLEARWRDQLKKPVRDFGVIEYIFIRNLLLMENVTTEVWPILGMNMASEHTKFGPPQPKLFTFASKFSFNLNLWGSWFILDVLNQILNATTLLDQISYLCCKWHSVFIQAGFPEVLLTQSIRKLIFLVAKLQEKVHFPFIHLTSLHLVSMRWKVEPQLGAFICSVTFWKELSCPYKTTLL